jgi:hypothetical protein
MLWVWWRFWACPHTVDTAAADFLHLRNPPRVRELLATRESWGLALTTDFTRRIGYIYGPGVSRHVGVDLPDIWSAGWNRRLLRACGAPSDPGAAAEHILRRVREMARDLPRDTTG